MSIFSKPAGQVERNETPGLSIIGAGTTVVGDISSEGLLKVEGTIQGTVRVGQQLLVARGGSIRGDAYASELVVGGEIFGGVHADERVEIQPGAVVNGDIRTLRIVVADGGRVNGQITMEPAPAEAPRFADSHIR
jgi:cytoskeletal protein CcmA (bactofilin family)